MLQKLLPEQTCLGSKPKGDLLTPCSLCFKLCSPLWLTCPLYVASMHVMLLEEKRAPLPNRTPGAHQVAAAKESQLVSCMATKLSYPVQEAQPSGCLRPGPRLAAQQQSASTQHAHELAYQPGVLPTAAAPVDERHGADRQRKPSQQFQHGFHNGLLARGPAIQCHARCVSCGAMGC